MRLLQLVMIVKDCQDVIARTLRSIKPFIDEWTILDTGSTDDTIDIINREMSGKTGSLHQEPFIDFSTSRNRVLDLAGTSCKYTIMLDDSYIIHNGASLLQLLKNTDSDSFQVAITDNRNRIYYSKRILKSEKKLRYRYRIHEIVQDCDSIAINYFDTRICIIDNRDWKSDFRTKNRLPTDLKILLEDHKENPDDTRIVYFLANTYYGLEKYEKALEFYRKRVEMGKEGEEIYVSQYMIGCLYSQLNKPIDEIVTEFLIAYDYDKRAEPLYQIGIAYYKLGDLEKAYEYIKKSYGIHIPTNRILQVEFNTYKEEIPTMMAQISLQLGKQDSKTILEKALKNNPKSRRLLNMKESISTTTEIVKKDSTTLIVFHTGSDWDPETMENASGSEIMVKNIAEELTLRGNRVIVFVKNINDRKLNRVEYKNAEKYDYIIHKTYIDTLIVSRFVDNLQYPNSVEKVYLWLHDIIPQGDSFQTHKTKFRGVLCLSKWHKSFFCKEYNFPEKMVYVTRNAIDFSRFNKSVKKIPYRFIYSSDPKRGLDNVMKVWRDITKKYPRATLYLFVNKNDIQPVARKEIKKFNNIFVHDRVDQERIAIEFLKSDVWFYPTNWRETYCITALEAQAAGVLCATTDLGSLPEVVGNRGIIDSNKKKLLKKLFYVLDNEKLKDLLVKKGLAWAKRQTIVNLVNDWENRFI